MKKIDELRILKSFVVLAIILVIFMPVSSAVLLNNIQVTGIDDIPGVRRGLDFTSVSVQVADVGNDTNLMTQITFDTPHESPAPPSNCEGGGSSYTCVYTSATGFIPSGVYPVTVNYPGTTSISDQFIADGDGPRIVSLNVYQEGEIVKAEYYIHDPEYAGTNTLTCSGIERIEFYVDGEIIETVSGQGDNATVVCEMQETITLPITTNGLHEVFIKAYDTLGNMKVSDVGIFETDFIPAIIDSTFKLIKDGEELTYINTKMIHTDLIVQFGVIEESDLSIVSGDLSDLNEWAFYETVGIRPNPSDFRSTCDFYSNNNSWVCSFYGINVDLETSNPVLHITVKDERGIEVQKGLNAEFEIDNDNATLQFLGTNLTHDGISYVTEGIVMFVAKLYDTGAGFRNTYTDVFNSGGGHSFIFNLGSFGGGEVLPAKDCTQSGSTWTCYKELTDVSGLTNGETLIIGVHPNSRDDAGNDVNVPEDINRTVIVDLNDPILWGNITVFESRSQRTEWFQDGDTLVFIAEIIEDESVIIPENALVDFSQIVEDEANYESFPAVECIPEVRIWNGSDWGDLDDNGGDAITGAVTAEESSGNPLVQTAVFASDVGLVEGEHTIYTCRWEVENVIPSNSGAYDNLVFTIKDIVGNEVVKEDIFIWILSLSTDENPNYFRYKAGKATPASIDRRAIAFVDYGVFVPVYIAERLITPSGVDAVPLKATFKECVEILGEDEVNHVSKFEAFGGITNPSNFSLFVEFKRGNYDEVEGISVKCTFDVVSHYGNKVSNVEEENITINVALFSSKYDPLDEAFLKKLKKKTVMMSKWMNWIEWAEVAIKNLRNMCDVSASLVNIDRVMNDIDQIWVTASMALYLVEPKFAKDLWEFWHDGAYCPYKTKVSDKLNWGLSSFSKKNPKGIAGNLNKACRYLTCEKSLWSLVGADEPDKAENAIKGFVEGMNEKVTGVINNFVTNTTLFGDGTTDSKTACGSIDLPIIGNKSGSIGWVPEGGFTLSDIGFPTVSQNIPDSSSSIYMAVASGCFPAIVHHLAQYRQIECKYLKCMGEMAVTGSPFDTCENDKSTETCKYVIGPFMDVIPNPVEYIQDVMDWGKNQIDTAPLTFFAKIAPGCQVFMNVSNNLHTDCSAGGDFSSGLDTVGDTVGEGAGVIGFLSYMALTAIPYGICVASEIDQKVKDLESMRLMETKLIDWIQVNAAWDLDKGNICYNEDVKDLMEKLGELE